MNIEIGDLFAQTIRGMKGEEGEQWLADLPALVGRLAAEWGLTVDAPYPNVAFNYVLPATTADGAKVVLKVSPHDEFRYEVAAVRLWNGDGCARLLRHDPDRNAMLIERVFPANTLASRITDHATDEAATTRACNVLRALPKLPPPADVAFPAIGDWAEALQAHRAVFGGTAPIPESLFREAEVLFAELLASSAPPVVLHGDLHQYNILQADETGANWIAIDPHGVLGEPEYEIGALLLNPNETLFALPYVQALTRRRLDQCAAELGYDRERMRLWGIARCVLSACWCLEDGGKGEVAPYTGWRYHVAVAELLKGS